MRKKEKRVIIYGTFDLLHVGHILAFKQAKELGDYLIVGLSTDEFNAVKNKKSVFNYLERKELLESIKYIDLVIPEENWEQKPDNIKKYNIDILAMGDDWKGSPKFEALKEYCEVVYLPRPLNISTTQVKNRIKNENY